MRHPLSHIFEFTPDALAAWMVERGAQKFRARQVLDWVYAKGVFEPALMTDLSKRDRDLIADADDGLAFLSGSTIADQHASDGTRKLLIQWGISEADGETAAVSEGAGTEGASQSLPLPQLRNELTSSPGHTLNSASSHNTPPNDPRRQTECVMIPTDDRRTACISSQVGCPVGCRFCASGIGGLDGNLSTGRIVEQVWRLRDGLDGPRGERRITNVVFMGMGEPLSNFKAVTDAVRVLTAPWGMGIGARKITISTVGLPKAIERLADELEVPVTLALSLHAPNDQIRRELIPWAEYTTIPELLDACQKWFAKTGREITLEYILLGGVNDRAEHARELADVARTIRANVNLIRYNEVRGMRFERPGDEDVRRFQEILRSRGVNTHIRASRGRDIAAACGQLRHEAAETSG